MKNTATLGIISQGEISGLHSGFFVSKENKTLSNAELKEFKPRDFLIWGCVIRLFSLNIFFTSVGLSLLVITSSVRLIRCPRFGAG